MINLIFKILKIAGSIFVVLSILFVAQCMYVETDQRDSLLELCGNLTAGNRLSSVLSAPQMEKFEIRSESLRSEKERDWFNRKYDEYSDGIKKNDDFTKALTIIFAKPGIGFYACIIVHDDDSVISAQYLDRSS